MPDGPEGPPLELRGLYEQFSSRRVKTMCTIGDVASMSWIETDERPRNVLRRDLDRVGSRLLRGW